MFLQRTAPRMFSWGIMVFWKFRGDVMMPPYVNKIPNYAGLHNNDEYMNQIWKSKDVNLMTKCRLVHPIVFPLTTYGCES